MYPVIFFDALRVKIRDDGAVRNKAIYLALAVATDGTRHVLGLWIDITEGAKFWMKVFNELRNRGVSDIQIAGVDSLKGLPEAIEPVFPDSTVQTCIVHLIRNSLNYAATRSAKRWRLRSSRSTRRKTQRRLTSPYGSLRPANRGKNTRAL